MPKYRIEELDVDGFLMSVSVVFRRRVEGFLADQQTKGSSLIPLMLDTVLFDSCSGDVRVAFVRAIEDQMEQMEKIKDKIEKMKVKEEGGREEGMKGRRRDEY